MAANDSERCAGGGSGIRTRDRVSPMHAFQACAFNRSATPPVATLKPMPRVRETSQVGRGTQFRCAWRGRYLWCRHSAFRLCRA
jgi:hypothetical protein